MEKERARVEIDGVKRTLALGQHYRSDPAGAGDRQSVTLAADGAGHFFAEGSVNGNPMRFVVDTGDALLICRKDLDQKVKDIVEVLKKGRPGYL